MNIIIKMNNKEILKWAKNIAWRPTKMTEETVKKLLDAFSYGFTDVEACIYADISKPTLYEYCKKFPNFTNHKEALKNKPKIKAKMNLLEDIKNKNVDTSKWYLERKSRDEFYLRKDDNGKKEIILEITDWDNALLTELN